MGMLLLSFVCVIALCQGTVLDTLRNKHETQLLNYIQQANLDTALSGEGPFTIFAPSNIAFLRLAPEYQNAINKDPNVLADVLKYHVVPGIVTSGDLMVNEKMLDTLSGKKIRVNYYMYSKHTTVEGAMITSPNNNASNGIVHIVDKLLLPPNGTIADMLASRPDLTVLKAAVDAAGLTSALADGPYTLFAPSDSAFNQLGSDKVNALLGEPELLSSILLYHVIHGTLYSKGMHSAYLHTLEETDRERLTSSLSGTTASVDGSRLMTKDLSATNGVVHIINHVLIPASLKAAVANL